MAAARNPGVGPFEPHVGFEKLAMHKGQVICPVANRKAKAWQPGGPSRQPSQMVRNSPKTAPGSRLAPFRHVLSAVSPRHFSKKC